MNAPDLIKTAIRAFKAGDLLLCETNCQQQLAASPDDAQALHLLGLVRHRQGRADSAVALISKAVERSPDELRFIINLGVALLANRQLKDALTRFRQATRIDPESVAAFNNLGATLKQCGQLGAAEQAYSKALALRPGDNEILRNLGLCLQLQGRLEEAADYMQASINSVGTALAHHNYGLLMKGLDRPEEAKAAQLAALQLDPAFASAWLYLVALTAYSDPEHPDLVAIKQLLLRTDIDEEAREHLHFALGKGLDDCGDFDAAFKQFQAGNRIMQRRTSYDRKLFEKNTTDTLARFTTDFIREHQLHTTATTAPLFIVGLPRTGKTRLERLLCKHPDIHRGGELYALPALTIHLLRKHWGEYPPEPGQDISREGLQQAAQRYRDFINKLAGDSRYITDTLPANTRHLGVIATLFPDARIISCTRTPEDTLISIYCKHFGNANKYARRLDDIRHYIRQHEQLMQHWQRVLPRRILEVRYEDLVTDTAATLQRAAEYCELAVSEPLLEDWRNSEMDRRFIGYAQHYRQYLED